MAAVLGGEGAAVGAPQHLVVDAARQAATEGVEDRTVALRVMAAVGVRVVDQLVQLQPSTIPVRQPITSAAPRWTKGQCPPVSMPKILSPVLCSGRVKRSGAGAMRGHGARAMPTGATAFVRRCRWGGALPIAATQAARGAARNNCELQIREPESDGRERLQVAATTVLPQVPGPVAGHPQRSGISPRGPRAGCRRRRCPPRRPPVAPTPSTAPVASQAPPSCLRRQAAPLAAPPAFIHTRILCTSTATGARGSED